jgi:hypothetical protein
MNCDQKCWNASAPSISRDRPRFCSSALARSKLAQLSSPKTRKGMRMRFRFGIFTEIQRERHTSFCRPGLYFCTRLMNAPAGPLSLAITHRPRQSVKCLDPKASLLTGGCIIVGILVPGPWMTCVQKFQCRVQNCKHQSGKVRDSYDDAFVSDEGFSIGFCLREGKKGFMMKFAKKYWILARLNVKPIYS